MFYYLDKFLLLSSSNSLYLYNYHLDPAHTDDIKRYMYGVSPTELLLPVCHCRYRNLCGYKLVQPLVMEDMQTITAVAAINDFLSRIPRKSDIVPL